MVRLTGLGPKIRFGAAAGCALACTFSSLAFSDKQETYNAMLGLAQQMRDLRPQVAGNPTAAELYRQLQAAYKAASDSLGGDDPARLYARHPQPAAGQTPPSAQPHVVGQRDEGSIAGNSTVPPGCASSALVNANGTDVPLVDGGTVTSTITFSGMPGTVWYVDSIQSITHTWSDDLDITLTSPAGTTITLTSDNGGSLDNVFDGTFWHDNANPFGQVPYTTNNGLATDHAYANLVVADDLVPEEPFHAFTGEDPNGVWTLTITDDTVTDTGTLLEWDLLVVTTAQPSNQTSRTFVNNTPVGIPVAGLASSSVSAAGMGGYVCDVSVRANITHTWTEDMDITLTSPSGSVVTLTTDNAGSLIDVYAGTVWDNDADPGAAGTKTTTDTIYTNLVAKNALTPEESLSTFRGEPAGGTWTLRVNDDDGAGDSGTINSWGITITTCSCGPSCPGDLNGDGLVNVNDLLGVITTWGGCP